MTQNLCTWVIYSPQKSKLKSMGNIVMRETDEMLAQLFPPSTLVKTCHVHDSGPVTVASREPRGHCFRTKAGLELRVPCVTPSISVPWAANSGCQQMSKLYYLSVHIMHD